MLPNVLENATTCMGCGAPIVILSSRIGNGYGASKIDLEDIKSVFINIFDKSTTTVKKTKEFVEEAFKSSEVKDQEDIDKLSKEFNSQKENDKTEHNIDIEKFKSALKSTIDIKFAEIISSKTATEKFLTYVDAQIMTATVRNVFKTILSLTPPQVEAACNLSEAVLAPSAAEKQNLIKSTIGLSGGTAGIGLVIGGVASALGWGASAVASVTAFFVGTSMAGPAGFIVAGFGLAAVAGYFATTSNKETNTERFLKVLRSAMSKAVDAIWEQHGDALTIAVNESKPPVRAVV